MSPALLLALALSAPAGAAAVAMPPGYGLTLPDGAALEAAWELPPSSAATAGSDVFPAVAPDGAVWLVIGRQVVSVPSRDALFGSDRPFQQVCWLGGRPLARSYDALGIFVPGPREAERLPRASFQPLTTVPFTSWTMAPAGEQDVYIAGYNPRRRASQVGLVGPGAGGRLLRVLYETPAQISAVAGADGTAYFAAGPAVWRLGGDGKAEVYWAGREGTIRDLLPAPGGGFFYVTDTGAGYAGPALGLELVRGPGLRIAARGDDLYVLLGGAHGGLLRLRGVGRLPGLAR